MLSGLTGLFLREVPSHLASGLQNGSLKLFGSVIRDSATGQIAGFLQEAAPLAQLIGKFNLNPLNIAFDAVGLVQNELLRQGISRVEDGIANLTRTGALNLATSAAGIGISVAGFAVLAHRLDKVKTAVNGVADKIDGIGLAISELKQDAIDRDLADLRTIAKAYDEAWTFEKSDRADQRWQVVAKEALTLQSRFEVRAEKILFNNHAIDLAEPFLDAIAFANAIRVSAHAACNETGATHQAVIDGGRTMDRLTGRIGTRVYIELAVARFTKDLSLTPATAEWDAAFVIAEQEATRKVAALRQREAAIATRTAPLTLAASRGLNSREWLKGLHEESQSALVLMLPD